MPTLILEAHFYDSSGLLIEVLSTENGAALVETLLRYTDKHDLVHISRRGHVVEVCETSFDPKGHIREKSKRVQP